MCFVWNVESLSLPLLSNFSTLNLSTIMELKLFKVESADSGSVYTIRMDSSDPRWAYSPRCLFDRAKLFVNQRHRSLIILEKIYFHLQHHKIQESAGFIRLHYTPRSDFADWTSIQKTWWLTGICKPYHLLSALFSSHVHSSLISLKWATHDSNLLLLWQHSDYDYEFKEHKYLYV
jgi:hypothetical protein